MTAPTPDELLLINCLLYTNDFESGENDSVYDWAYELSNDTARLDSLYPPQQDPNQPPPVGPGEMTRAEFDRVLNSVLADPNFQSMNIVDVDVRPGSPLSPDKPGDELVMTTIDYNGQPIIVYKGTGGDIQWRGNGTDGYYDVTDTLEQQYALNYFTTMMQRYPGMEAYVSGHSAGGNAAQYVTILAGDQVSQCFSFDGPGFNPAFYAKYADLVDANGEKIYGVSNYSDFVGILFGSMASVDGLSGHDLYTGDGTLYAMDAHSFRRFHSPYTIFTPDGSVVRLDLDNASSTPAGPLDAMALADGLVSYLEAFMNRDDFKYLCWMAMGFLIESGHAGDYGEPVQMPDDFIVHLLQMIKGYAEYRGVDPQEVLAFVTGQLNIFLDQHFSDAQHMDAVKALASGLGGFLAMAAWSTVPSLPYSVAPREFTQDVLDQLLALVADNYQPIIMNNWLKNLWDRVASWFNGGVDYGSETFDQEAYYRDMIEKNHTSAQKFQQIWDDVAAKDAEFAGKIQGWTSRVDNVKDLADKFAEKIRTS